MSVHNTYTFNIDDLDKLNQIFEFMVTSLSDSIIMTFVIEGNLSKSDTTTGSIKNIKTIAVDGSTVRHLEIGY